MKKLLRILNRITNSSLFCFCVWLAFALWVWSILDSRGHKQMLIGGAASIVYGVVRLIGNRTARAK